MAQYVQYATSDSRLRTTATQQYEGGIKELRDGQVAFCAAPVDIYAI